MVGDSPFDPYLNPQDLKTFPFPPEYRNKMIIKDRYYKPSLSLNKFLKSQKNLSKTPPKLFPNDPKPQQLTHTIRNNPNAPILDLNHPILQKLEKSCTNIKQFNQIHAQLIVLGHFQHPFAASRYIKKLCTCLNSVSHCVSLYNHIEEPDAFMCNIIMRSFVNVNDPFGALRFYYGKMIARWVLPNHYTFPLVVKVCADIGSLREGQKVHALVVKFGFELDLFVRNSFIHFYSVCGRASDAKLVFDIGFVLDLVSWNSMIDGHVKNGEVGLAREIFDEMSERDIFSWNSMISGYVGVGDMEAARGLFEKMPSRDVVSWNCMIDGYARIKDVSMAAEFFDKMPLRNVVSWNVMLALYLRCKKYSECLRFFDLMLVGDSMPNEASLVSVLTACAELKMLGQGKWVHSYMKEKGIKPDVLLSTALLTMYAKCRAMDLAREVFDEMPEKSVVSWNSMIVGYGMHGCGDKALEMFLEMEKGGPMPNDATFMSVLSACSHSGMVWKGWWYFDLMHRKYKIQPKPEHYGLLVDLLGQAGLIEPSEELPRKIHTEAEPTLWVGLLSACRAHSILEPGEILAKQLIKLFPNHAVPYSLLSNTYAAEGRWDDLENLRMTLKNKTINSKLVFTRRRHSMSRETAARMKWSDTDSGIETWP
ncbi:unnamed protein product [Dovyalis caffra]|uniref:Chlororespiratory reduction 4 n=1 Tax=Dovyalis caffra TaxID=77055 RepID=A0AAV1SQD2_9ROSI|nr:unnamed protein product [Dovyalis caffra]